MFIGVLSYCSVDGFFVNQSYVEYSIARQKDRPTTAVLLSSKYIFSYLRPVCGTIISCLWKTGIMEQATYPEDECLHSDPVSMPRIHDVSIQNDRS